MKEFICEREIIEKSDGGLTETKYRTAHNSESDSVALERRVTNEDGVVLCSCDGTLRAVNQCLATTVPLEKIRKPHTAAIGRRMASTCAEIGMNRLVRFVSRHEKIIEGKGRSLEEYFGKDALKNPPLLVRKDDKKRQRGIT